MTAESGSNRAQGATARAPGAIVLVTGPSRSGKSEWAEQLATQLLTRRVPFPDAAQGPDGPSNCRPRIAAPPNVQNVIYVATAQIDPTDTDWQARIQRHRQRRPVHWHLWEVPTDLAAALGRGTAADCLLIDSLGTWVANGLQQDDPTWAITVDQVLQALQQTPSSVILVAEETGWGVVPAYATGRLFRDRLGHLSRQVGALAAAVYLVAAGYAVDLKVLGQPVGLVREGQADRPG